MRLSECADQNKAERYQVVERSRQSLAGAPVLISSVSGWKSQPTGNLTGKSAESQRRAPPQLRKSSGKAGHYEEFP
jgi:hypothetical protein